MPDTDIVTDLAALSVYDNDREGQRIAVRFFPQAAGRVPHTVCGTAGHGGWLVREERSVADLGRTVALARSYITACVIAADLAGWGDVLDPRYVSAPELGVPPMVIMVGATRPDQEPPHAPT